MTPLTKRFLIVDDDPINNFLSIRALQQAFNEVHINDFTIPEEGLEFMKTKSSQHPADGKITLLLDINMPTMSGWEYLEEFELFDASIKKQYDIYILSSSVDSKDVNRAKENPIVKDFIEKPLSKATLLRLFG